MAARAWAEAVAGPAAIAEVQPRAERLLELVGELLPEWEAPSPRGGLVLWVRLPTGSAAAFCQHAARHGVLLTTGRPFGDDGDQHLRLPYTAAEGALDEGVRRLARAWHHFDPELAASSRGAAFV